MAGDKEKYSSSPTWLSNLDALLISVEADTTHGLMRVNKPL